MPARSQISVSSLMRRCSLAIWRAYCCLVLVVNCTCLSFALLKNAFAFTSSSILSSAALSCPSQKERTYNLLLLVFDFTLGLAVGDCSELAHILFE